MLRTLLCSAMALVLAVTFSFAADDAKEKKKKDRGNVTAGTVKKFDAATGTLTVTVRDRKTKTTEDKEFKVTESAAISVFVAGEAKPKSLTGKEGLAELKDGAAVVVKTDNEGKVLGVQIGRPERKKKTN